MSLSSDDYSANSSMNTDNSQARAEVRINTLPQYAMLRLWCHFNIMPKK
ncbi:hypothetical protein [Segatella bryantii]|nr:hypothetical protein [Segatella bryantii]